MTGFASPDVPAYVTYAIVLIFGTLVAAHTVNQLLGSQPDRWAFPATWLVFLVHAFLPAYKDHVILVEAPLNEERSVALIAETRKLVPGKPIRYVVHSHHHFDHAGGLRAFVAEGVTVITHEFNRAFLEQALGAPATIRPDLQAKSGRKPMVEGMGDRRTLTDGTRTVEIYRIQGILHHDGMLMVYLPKEKLLSQADAFTPVAPNVTPPTPPSPYNVALADNIARLRLDVGDLLPLHGRLVPLAELHRTIGRTP